MNGVIANARLVLAGEVVASDEPSRRPSSCIR